MKNKNIFKIVFACMLLTSIVSCKKGFLEGYDSDPNNPTKVSPDLLLPSAIAGASSIYGDDYARFAGIWMQQFAGTDRQFASIDKYNQIPTDLDNIWTFNAYPGALEDLHLLIKDSEAKENWAYSGIAKTIMAASMGVMTDCFGDVPYSEAFDPDKTKQPKFDSQQDIYASINTLLTEAATDLDKETVLAPGPDDLFYGGDVDHWKAAINSLKARYAIHLSKKDPNSYANALAAIDAGAFKSNADDLELIFGETEGNANWWYAFQEQRAGYLSMGKYMVDTMNGLNDPRREFYMDSTGIGFVGSPAGDPSDAAVIGSYYGSINSPIPFISYVEVKFIEAEAAFKTGDLDRAATAHNDAVKASILKITGAPDATYEAANASETAGTITLEKIMLQKYIALFTQIESWTDWRRTGLPAISPATNNLTNGVIPRRFLYAQSELLYNKNTPTVLITDKVWWDQ